MKFVKGDLLDAPEKIIAHGCNAQGVMGSGVALAIKNKYPSAYISYMKLIKYCKDNLKSPLCHCAVAFSKDKIILNAITQEFYGRDGKQYVNYEAVTRSLARGIKALLAQGHDVRRIAIPKIGAGLGGGDWEIIKGLLADIETVLEIEFIIYTLEN
jgi:O-acetyl-ADP-ribose deacetylase (regulator of RNase III)